MSFLSRRFAPFAAVAAAVPYTAAAQPASDIDEVVVTADFREGRIEELPVSVTVLDRSELRAATQQHFEEAIRLVPNLNLSGEGSRVLSKCPIKAAPSATAAPSARHGRHRAPARGTAGRWRGPAAPRW